eukprot:6320167-Amphidinium_carterae.1
MRFWPVERARSGPAAKAEEADEFNALWGGLMKGLNCDDAAEDVASIADLSDQDMGVVDASNEELQLDNNLQED